ncbi:PspC domain-containing protein [Sphingomonas sp. GCM10030256]|uniref:PspC domain-containing protein n=1 Tax=Sphingomonas sp. GCM10030256 TaxID=3273427 RepID=UPI003613A627
MSDKRTPLPLRSDNLLGVCQAIGDDFGFNPTYLRLLLAVPMAWQPLYAVAVYFGLGVVVLLSRLVFPDRTVAAADTAVTPAAIQVRADEPLREYAEAA